MSHRMPPPSATPISESRQPGRQPDARQHAERDAGQRHRVRQDAVVDVDEGEHDQHGRERPAAPAAAAPARRRTRAARTPRRSAARPPDSAPRSARRRTRSGRRSSSQLDDRHVVVPAQRLAAAHAARRRVDDRLAQRDAVDADVEEAADRQAEQAERDDDRAPAAEAGHGRGTGRRARRRLVRQRRAASTPSPRLTSPVQGSEREDEAVRVGRDRRAGSRRGPAPAT